VKLQSKLVGAPDAGKLARTVWRKGKAGNFDTVGLPIPIAIETDVNVSGYVYLFFADYITSSWLVINFRRDLIML